MGSELDRETHPWLPQLTALNEFPGHNAERKHTGGTREALRAKE